MKTHKAAGAVGMELLEGPANPGQLFLTRNGIGGLCACGHLVLAKTPEAAMAGLDDHQVPAYCAWWRKVQAEADPEELATE